MWIGPAFSATVRTLKACGWVKRLATEKTSNGPQKSRTSTSSKIKMVRVRVVMEDRPFAVGMPPVVRRIAGRAGHGLHAELSLSLRRIPQAIHGDPVWL